MSTEYPDIQGEDFSGGGGTVITTDVKSMLFAVMYG